MRITLRDSFDAPVELVERAVLEPAFQQRLLDLPNVAERSVLSQDERPDGTVRRVVRYRYGGDVPGPVQAVVGNVIGWDEIGIFHPDAHEWRFVVEPHVAKGQVDCAGRYRFVPDGGGTLREVDLELRVKIPLVGGRVERAIAEGLEETIAAEARFLRDYLKERV